MTDIFDTLINTYISDKVGIANNFLSEELAAALKVNLLKHYANQDFKPAGTGNNQAAHMDKQVRGDQIYWLDRKHEEVAENQFFDLMDQFVQYLNMTCYTGIVDYEFHYAIYENGDFYAKHKDQFRNNPGRAFSLITYLNSDWKKADGGELCIYHEHHTQEISPASGKSTFFKSDELVHEVLLTTQQRLSITGWLKTSK